jgi:hypothetical protein
MSPMKWTQEVYEDISKINRQNRLKDLTFKILYDTLNLMREQVKQDSK